MRRGAAERRAPAGAAGGAGRARALPAPAAAETASRLAAVSGVCTQRTRVLFFFLLVVEACYKYSFQTHTCI